MFLKYDEILHNYLNRSKMTTWKKVTFQMYSRNQLTNFTCGTMYQYTFLDPYIRVVDHKFITGIYHKVDDFNFEVISYPFPQSNIHSMLGYSTYYSQLIRFFRLCNNINDFFVLGKI